MDRTPSHPRDWRPRRLHVARNAQLCHRGDGAAAPLYRIRSAASAEPAETGNRLNGGKTGLPMAYWSPILRVNKVRGQQNN